MARYNAILTQDDNFEDDTKINIVKNNVDDARSKKKDDSYFYHSFPLP
jgi:hypothetical protein